jgi:tripartite ATP-independent transporter DctP family solute receptor
MKIIVMGVDVMNIKLFAAMSIIGLAALTACSSGDETAPAPSGGDSAGVAVSEAFANGPSYKLKIGHVQATTHPYQVGSLYIAKELENRSGGKITADVFPSSQLGGERDMTESVQMGTLDIVITGTAVVANFDPAFTVFDFPFLFESREHAYAVLDGEFGRTKMAGLEAFDMVGLGFFENGFFDVMNSKHDVTRIEDLRGLNIRTMENAVYMAAFSAYGANPVPMAASEVFTALQNGTVDGCCLSINAIYALKWHQPQKSYMLADMFFCPIPVLMSKSVYDAMPEAYRQLIREVVAEACNVERQESINQEGPNLQAMKDEGINVTKPDDRDAWVRLIEEKVYPQFRDKVPQSMIDEIKGYAR